MAQYYEGVGRRKRSTARVRITKGLVLLSLIQKQWKNISQPNVISKQSLIR